MKRHITRVAPAAALACIPAPSIAVEPAAPFAAEKNAAGEHVLSYQLERRFDRLISDCSIPKPLKMKKGSKDRTVSAIDADVIEHLRLNQQLDSQPAIYAPVEGNLARIFGYIFPEAEKDAPAFVNDNFLKIDYREDPTEGLAPGFPQLRLEASCGSVLQAAMDANAGYDFGIGSVKAALDAEFDSEQEVTFQIASGRFVSPIWEMWTGTNIEQANQSAKKFYAATLFWNWYQQSARSGKFYLLEDFYGTTLYRQLARNKRSGASASIEARLQVPFFTGGGTTSGSIGHDEEMSAQDFAVYLSKRAPGGGKSTTYRELPSLDDVIAAVAAHTSSEYYPQDATGRLVQAGQSRSFYHDVRHLPSSYCEQNAWQVRDTAAAAAQSAVMVLEGIDRVSVDDRNICRFRMAYTPEDFTLDSDVTLTPHLFSTAQAANKRLVAAEPDRRRPLPRHQSDPRQWPPVQLSRRYAERRRAQLLAGVDRRRAGRASNARDSRQRFLSRGPSDRSEVHRLHARRHHPLHPERRGREAGHA
jgi:hypothetical protein